MTPLRHLHHTCAAGCAPPRPPLASQVLFSSWLYIAIYATKVNRNRWSEVRKLTKRLSGEFLLLQVTFLLGIIFAEASASEP